MKKFLLFICALMIQLALFGQESNDQLIPQVIPQSPDVVALGKFGTYPVNHFTGLVNIEIPLYEVTAGDIKVPIVLKYHSSGIKVTDRPGWVGLGWSLQAGGTISRQIVGLKDEDVKGYLSGNTIPAVEEIISQLDQTDIQYLSDVNDNKIDTNPDIFQYSFGGSSGQFVFNQSNNYEKVYIPLDAVRIDNVNAINSANLRFMAYDLIGNRYDFNDKVEHTSVGDDFSGGPITAWRVGNITSSKSENYVNFSYHEVVIPQDNIIDKLYVTDEVDNALPGFSMLSPSYQNLMSSNHYTSITAQHLNEITFPYGKVEFIGATREDVTTKQNSEDRLAEIRVHKLDPATNQYVLIKSIKFFQSYFGGNQRLRLDAIEIKNDQDVNVQRYNFEYNEDHVMPNYISRARDYWGYYNGKINNTTMIPKMEIFYQPSIAVLSTKVNIGASDPDAREPSAMYMPTGSLKSITYPTGGRTEYFYEPNKYLDNQNQEKLAGGLRIKQTKSYDNNNPNPTIKTYKYGVGESGYGRDNFILNDYIFTNEWTTRHFHPYELQLCDLVSKCRTRLYQSVPSIALSGFDGAPVIYPVVTVYEGNEFLNTGKTVYSYTDQQDVLNFRLGIPSYGSFHFRRGLLKNKKIIKLDENQIATTISATSNSYFAFPKQTEDYIGFKVRKIWVNQNSTGSIGSLGAKDPTSGCAGSHDTGAYMFTYYPIITGDNKITSSTEIQLPDGVNSINSSTSYLYDNPEHLQLTRKIVTQSNSEPTVTQYKYPLDYDQVSRSSTLDAMIAKNMVAVSIEVVERVKGEVVSAVGTKYFYDITKDLVLPDNVYRYETTTPSQGYVASSDGENFTAYTNKLNYEQYDDRGNILQYSLENNITTSFIYGIDNQLPIVKAVNLDYANLSTIVGNVLSEMSGGSIVNIDALLIAMGDMTTQGQKDLWVSFNDGLRQAMPTTTLFNTYTFDILVGIRTVTDPNNITVYYEYDDFGRLEFIKDHEGNIMKTYAYNYQYR